MQIASENLLMKEGDGSGSHSVRSTQHGTTAVLKIQAVLHSLHRLSGPRHGTEPPPTPFRRSSDKDCACQEIRRERTDFLPMHPVSIACRPGCDIAPSVINAPSISPQLLGYFGNSGSNSRWIATASILRRVSINKLANGYNFQVR